MLGAFLDSLTQLPLMARFALAMVVVLVVPAMGRKIHLPVEVGLLLAGVVFGPHGLHVGPKSHEVAHFFADVGKLLLLFFAGMKTDVAQFRRTGHRSLLFGLATFAAPLAGGVVAGLGFGYGWLAALLVGSLLTVGFLIDVRVFVRTIVEHIGFVVAIVGGLILSKLLAALFAQRVFGYSRYQGLLMWSLALPQVAATLAAALVAFQARNADGKELIDEPVLNTVIVL
jgi:Kef-type K+ transport system membrane component KefB